jgi:phage tail-like protein
VALAADTQLGVGMRFKVTIDDTNYDLGSWSKVSGLDVTWDIAEYRAGDGQNDKCYFPGLTKYSTVKLERAVQAEGTKKVREWLDSNSFKMKVQSGKVALLDAKSEEVMFWTLRHVIPGKWSISPFDANASKVAIEVLELVHMGFLENE